MRPRFGKSSHPLARYGTALFIGFSVSAVVWLILIDTPVNAGFNDSARWLWIPLLVVVALYTWRYWSQLRDGVRGRKPWWVVVQSAAMFLMLLLYSWPHSLLFNAIGAGDDVRLRGPVVDKHVASGRYRSYHVAFVDEHTGMRTVIDVPRGVYEQVVVGHRMVCRFRRGSLGFLYRWRYGQAAPACVYVR